MSLQFHPLRDHPSYGLLEVGDGPPVPAVYVHHSGYSRSRPPRDIGQSQMDRFAELLSEDLTVTEAAKRMGFDYAYGNAMLQRIRRKLGRQAT